MNIIVCFIYKLLKINLYILLKIFFRNVLILILFFTLSHHLLFLMNNSEPPSCFNTYSNKL